MPETFKCFTLCPYFEWVSEDGRSAFVRCKALPGGTEFEVIPAGDSAPEFFEGVREGKDMKLPYPCQVVEPTLITTIALYISNKNKD